MVRGGTDAGTPSGSLLCVCVMCVLSHVSGCHLEHKVSAATRGVGAALTAVETLGTLDLVGVRVRVRMDRGEGWG